MHNRIIDEQHTIDYEKSGGTSETAAIPSSRMVPAVQSSQEIFPRKVIIVASCPVSPYTRMLIARQRCEARTDRFLQEPQIIERKKKKMNTYEEMALNAWPAIKTVVHKGCMYRSSSGYTNRANSANPLYSEKDDIRSIIIYAERFYSQENLPCVFKIIDNETYRGLDQTLAQEGYIKITETNVLTCDIRTFRDSVPDGIIIENSITEKWFESFVTISQIAEQHIQTAWKLLNLIAVDLMVASVCIGTETVACGYGAIENDFAGFFDIVVSKEKRGNGLGRRLMNGIITEAGRRGVKTGYLQVVGSNEIAKNLYSSIGFHPLYNYWYRKKP